MSKKKRVLRAVLVLEAVFAVLYIFWYDRNRKEVETEFVFTYAENQPEDYPTTLGGRRFAELVEERTDGRIKILIFAGGELGMEGDVLKQMQYGGIDFARVSLSQVSGIVPKMNILQMPYLYTDSAHMWRVLEGEIGESFLAEADAYDLIGLSWYDAGARSFYNMVKPITCMEDMQGMRIRVQESDLMIDMVEALGAVAVPVDYSDVYSSLERGEVDGAENNWPSYETSQHYEVAKYFTMDEHTRVPEMQLCSKHTWDKLSDEDKEIIRQCAKESSVYERQLWETREERSKELVVARGTVVTELSSEEKKRFQDAMQSVYEKYYSEYMDTIEMIQNER